jgi:hypothetical protein
MTSVRYPGGTARLNPLARPSKNRFMLVSCVLLGVRELFEDEGKDELIVVTLARQRNPFSTLRDYFWNVFDRCTFGA